MARFSNNLIIGRPINEVFRFVADFENMPKWNYYVVEVNKVTSGPIGIGTVFRQVRKTDTQKYKIVEFEPNRKVVVETLPPARRCRCGLRLSLRAAAQDLPMNGS